MNMKVKKNNIRRILSIIIFASILLIFDYIGKNNYNLERHILGSSYTLGNINYFIFSIITIIFVSFNLKTLLKEIPKYIFNRSFRIWIIYSLCVLISGILAGNSYARSILNMLCVPIIAFIIIPNKFFKNNLDILGKALILSNIVMLSYYMLSTDRGISNSMGIILVTTAMGWIAFINSRIIQNKNITIGIILFLLNGVAVSLTSSRTAFVAYILSFVAILGVILFFKSNARSKIKIIFIICILIITIISFSDVWYDMFSNIIDKFLVRRNESNMLSGREDIWNVAFSNIKLFGNGINFFHDNGFLHAHNSFLAILGIDGIIALTAFSIFQLKMIYNSFFYYLENNLKSYSIIPLLINVLFVLISITEDVWYRPYLLSIHLIWFLCNGIIVTDLVKKEGKKKCMF